MDKSTLIENIRSQRAALDAVVARLSDDDMQAPILEDGWSIKDTLAHIAWWEGSCASWIENRASNADRLPAGYSFDNIDRLNNDLHAEQQKRPLAAVRDDARSAHAAIIAAIEPLADADLAVSHYGWPALDEMIRSNTTEHYEEHLSAIDAAAAGRG